MRREPSTEVIVYVNDETKWNLKQNHSYNHNTNDNRKRLIVDLIKNRSSLNKNYSKINIFFVVHSLHNFLYFSVS
jgi:hypothetical protein